MTHYEMLCVLPGTLTETEVSDAMKAVTEAVTSQSATVSKSVDKGKSRLAYPIKHIRYGYFQLLYIEAEPGSVAEIQRRVRLLGTLLRLSIHTYDATRQSELAEFSLSPQPQNRDEETAKPTERTPRTETKKPAAVVAEPKQEAKKEEKTSTEEAEAPEEKKEDVSLEEIDTKLDEILEKDLSKV